MMHDVTSKQNWPEAILVYLVAFSMFLASSAKAASLDLTTLSLEELMEIEITSVAKRTQKLKNAPAAVFVITQEDIRRSGATTLADLLRMVPGVHVAKIDAQSYGVSVRGFSDRFANKLLVLVDGRTIYNPLFSGVFWEYVDTVLEDIDRIEVIRGPGASLWGANAVNGIINIITKKASDTQGFYVSGGAGSEDLGILSLRYGNSLSNGGAYRVYLKTREHDSSRRVTGEDGVDDWREVLGGFRLDLNPASGDTLMLQGQVQHWKGDQLEITQGLTGPVISCHACHSSTIVYDSVHFMGQWRREDNFGNAKQIKAFVQYERATGSAVMEWNSTVFDVEYQQEYLWRERHRLTWGAGFRFYRIDTLGSHGYHLVPEDSEWTVLNAFLQDEFAVVPDHLILTAGTKLEYHEGTGIGFQPTGRLMWNVNDRNALWVAISRALRTPSRGEQDVIIRVATRTSQPPPADTILFNIYGNDDLEFEELTAFEAGYRTQLSDRMTLDLAAFYNRYDNLIAVPEPGQLTVLSDPIPHVEATARAENMMDGEVYGLELEANVKLTDWWKLKGAYTFARTFLHVEDDRNTVLWGEDWERQWPSHMLSLRSQWDIRSGLELDLWLRYVSGLSSTDIPAYFTGDVRLAWRPRPNFEISLVGQNIFESAHSEFAGSSVLPSVGSEVERSVFCRVSWSF